MADIPGGLTTTSTIAVGGSASDSIETSGDHDWFAIQLAAGQSISVTLNGVSLADPLLNLRNAAGTVLYTNDDGGPGLNALLSFSAPTTGTYYIDVTAAQAGQTGTYQLSVAPYSLPSLGTIDQFAQWMTSGFWDGDSHHFPVTQGGTITVNLTGLTSDGLLLARTALDLWTDVIGVTFTEVGTGGDIVFDDLETGTGAFSDGVWSGGITQSATVNVAPSRFGSGTGIARIGLQTYIHEIGHALGLGHAGDYNGGTAFSRYPYEATWLNDGAAISVMSYFDNGENSYYASQGFTNALVTTPQIADVAGVALLYGLSTTTRTGDTTYGFHNNSGREVFDASLHPGVAYTIIDSGGIDTLDYSSFGANQRIDLNPETFSNVGSSIGNVSIARGTVIENAIGGSGSDVLIGNSADNVLTGSGGSDMLTGGIGRDTFRDSAGGLNGDTITDFSAADRIIVTNASLPGFTFNLTGHTLNYSGGSITLGGLPAGSIVAHAAAGGGVELMLTPRDATNDFNGDGRSDILWRDGTGLVTDWLGTSSGGFANNDANFQWGVPLDWTIAGTGDFNGDHRDDILWRNGSGVITNWLGNLSGGFASNDSNALTGVPTDWQVAGTADFNGDGRSDVLWRHSDGTITDWLGGANGGFGANWANSAAAVPLNWHIMAVGDFNGDQRGDILWRDDNGVMTDWLGTGAGGFADNWANASGAVALHWTVAGVGDFNGDGRDDILWRNTDGTVTDWLGTATGGFAANWNSFASSIPNDWSVAQIGDFDGDARNDVLWRNSSGTITNWLGTPTGAFADNWTNAAHPVATSWHVESQPFA